MSLFNSVQSTLYNTHNSQVKQHHSHSSKKKKAAPLPTTNYSFLLSTPRLHYSDYSLNHFSKLKKATKTMRVREREREIPAAVFRVASLRATVWACGSFLRATVWPGEQPVRCCCSCLHATVRVACAVVRASVDRGRCLSMLILAFRRRIWWLIVDCPL